MCICSGWDTKSLGLGWDGQKLSERVRVGLGILEGLLRTGGGWPGSVGELLSPPLIIIPRGVGLPSTLRVLAHELQQGTARERPGEVRKKKEAGERT